MAQGKRNGGHNSARVATALDACVTRMRQGESLQRCLADHPELEAVLEPLLSVAQELSEHDEANIRATVPPPPDGLQPGRARMLAAAAALRARSTEASANGAVTAGMEASARQERAATALDDALTQGLANGKATSEQAAFLAPNGDSPRRDIDPAIAALTGLVQQMRARTVTPPAMPPAALARGRQRMLAAAERQRTQAQAAVARAEAATASEAVSIAATTKGADVNARLLASDHLLEALDAALAGVIQGRSHHDVLQAHRDDPALAAAMAPLLEVATHVREARVAAPDATPSLDRGRARFLALAAAARGVAEAAGTLAGAQERQAASMGYQERSITTPQSQATIAEAPSALLHEWLDAAWAAMAAGADIEEALTKSGVPAAQWAAIRPLLDLALQARASSVPVAVPQGQPGRARMLAVAAEARTQRQAREQANTRAQRTRRDAALAGWLATLRGFLGGGLAAGPRAAVLSLCILFGLVGVNALAYPAYATTLPGEPLYAMKRLSRGTRLAVAGALAPVSPERASNWRTQIERDRVAEVVQLQDDGRQEIADLPGRLAGFQDKSEGETQRGTIHVSVEPDQPQDTPQLVIVDWDARTEFSLPEAYGSMASVPRGAPVSVRVRTGDERPLALRVRVGLLAPTGVQTATATATPTPDPDHTPNPGPPVTNTVSAPSTATIAATATVSITQTPQPSPTLMATATITAPTMTATPIVTPTLAATPTATPGGSGNGGGASVARPSFLVLRGSVLALEHDEEAGRWILLLRVDDNPADERKIDVTALAGNKRLADEWSRIERGARVALEVVPRDDGRLWEARGLASRVQAQSCSNHNITAVVSELVAGQHLRIAGRDDLYLLQDTPADAVTGQIMVGARILMHYADCGLGGLRVQQVRVLSGPGSEDGAKEPRQQIEFRGIRIVSVDATSSPAIVVMQELPAGREWRVEVVDGSVEGGDVSDLRAGMVVSLEAEVLDEGEGRLRALKLKLPLFAPSATPPPSVTPAPPTATPTIPAPTPTDVAELTPPDMPELPIPPPASGDDS